jgi:hypothetical protein
MSAILGTALPKPVILNAATPQAVVSEALRGRSEGSAFAFSYQPTSIPRHQYVPYPLYSIRHFIRNSQARGRQASNFREVRKGNRELLTYMSLFSEVTGKQHLAAKPRK